MSGRRFRCANNHEWDIPAEMAEGALPEACPICSSTEMLQIAPFRGRCSNVKRGRRRCRRGGLHEIAETTSETCESGIKEM